MINYSKNNITLRINYNYNSASDLFGKHFYNSPVYYGTGLNLSEYLCSKCTKEFSLSKLKKLYFDPNCKFPRNKLTTHTDIKRSIKLSTADAVVVSCLKFNESWNNINCYYSESTDTNFHIYDYDLRSNKINSVFGLPKPTLNNLLPHLIQHGYVPQDTVVKYSGSYVNINEKILSSIYLLQSDKPFILDLDLDERISATMESASKDDLQSISEMLESSDKATVSLGMNLLLNYNVLNSACSVGLMLLKNKNNISFTNAFTSVGFTNILKSLGLSKDALYRYHLGNCIPYLTSLYNISQNDEDKEMAKSIILEMLEKEFSQIKNHFSDVADKLGINIDINIK